MMQMVETFLQQIEVWSSPLASIQPTAGNTNERKEQYLDKINSLFISIYIQDENKKEMTKKNINNKA